MAGSSAVLEDGSLLSRLDRALLPIERIAALMSGLASFSLMFLAAWSPAPFGIPLFGLFGLVLAFVGVGLFGALGIHVIFARYLDIRFWRGRVMSLIRFFSWRRSG